MLKLRLGIVSVLTVVFLGTWGIHCKDVGPKEPIIPPPGVSFSQQIQPLFGSYGCTGCHPGNAGLDLREGQSYGNLVNVQALAQCTDKKRVLPGNAAESVLYLRLSGTTCGGRMPQDSDPISSSHLQLVQDWINQGARQN